MDKKVTTERDQSTEQLFSLRESNGKQLETAEEPLDRAAGNDEELFLQNVFLDKSANSNQAQVKGAPTESREQGIAWERGIPGAEAPDSGQQAALDNPGRSDTPAAEFQAGISLNEYAPEKTTPGIGALDASRGHALRVDDATGTGSDYLTVSAVQQGSSTEDNSVTFRSTDLLSRGSATDGDKLQVTGVSVDADYGAITANADGSWTFTPAADHQGDDLPLSVTVSDGTTSTRNDTRLNISQVNDRPTEGGVDTGATAADSPSPSGTDSNTDPQSNASDIDVHVDVDVDMDMDVDAPAPTDASGASGNNPHTGSTGGSDLPPPTPVNTGPSAAAVDLGSTAEDTATTFSSSELLANASDIDGDELQVAAVEVDPAYGNVTANPDGSWTFNPAADYNGEDVPLSFTVSDGTDSTQGSASLDISAVNDGPSAAAVDLGSTAEDTATTFSSAELLANASDIDGDELQVAAVEVDPAYGNVTANPDGSWTFNPAADYNGEDVPLSFTVSDGTDSTQGSASLDISAVNDGPSAAAVDLGSTAEDTATTFSSAELLANASDIDGDELQVAAVEVDPAYGNVTANPDGSWTFNPAADYNGEDVPLSFTVSDGTDSTQGSASLDISAVNDGPSVAAVDLGSTAEDTATTFSSSELLANASDIDGDELQVAAVEVDPAYGNVTANPDGSWTFNPAADYNGEDVPLSFTVSDGTDSTQGSASLDVIAQSVEGIELYGTRGSDTLVGTAGDDTFNVVGNAGLDQIDGGAGNDTIQGSRYSDTIQVSDNLDNIQNIENIDGGAGYDVLQAGRGNDTLDFSDAPALSNIEEIDGGYGDDTIIGTAGNDNIEGNRGNDTLAGGDGDDTFMVAGNAGLDQVDGGAGNDTIQGSRYSDTIQVSDNLDNIQNIENIDGGAGYDVLQAGRGNDTLDFSDAPALSNIEEIDGGYGDDTIIGTAGNDNIEGNRGNDTLAGGDGDDTFMVAGNAGLDQVDGGAGNDTIQGSRYSDTIQVSDNLDNIQNIENIDGGAGYDVLQAGRGNDTLDFSDAPALSNIEEIDGGYGDDTIIGTAGNDNIEGNRGNDTLAGGDGDDTFMVAGNAGLDQVDGGAGNDTIQGSRYSDTIQVSDNLDNIQNIENIDGGAGYDVLQAGRGNDTLDFSDAPALSNIEEIDGGYGDDTIIGTAGNDNIEGNRGNDTLAGGDGDDTFMVAGNAGLDQVDGGAGNDTIQGSRYSDTIQVSDNLDNIQNIENIDGGAGYDVLQAGRGNDTLDFSDAPTLSNIEEIDGGYGDDTIIGTAGNDNIEGNRGNDTLAGGDGDDTFMVAGNAGLDQVDGGAGNDTIQGSRYSDTIQVSDNLDNIQNIENIDGGAGYDVLQAGSGNDTLDFSDAPALSNIEEIDGGYGDDTIIGTAGNDNIEGNRGNDTLAGGGGDDTLDGGYGTDTLRLQGLRNEYQISQREDSGYTIADTVEDRDGTDTIENFELVQFQDQTSSVEDLLNPVEPEPAAAAEISGEELLYAMDAGTGPETGQGWAESVQAEDTDSGVAQDSAWDSLVDAGQAETDLAATAMELTPDTTGVIATTEVANSGVEGLETLEA